MFLPKKKTSSMPAMSMIQKPMVAMNSSTGMRSMYVDPSFSKSIGAYINRLGPFPKTNLQY